MPSVHDLLDADERLVYEARTSWFAPVLASPAGSLLVIGGLASLSLVPLLDLGMALLVGHATRLPEWIQIVSALAGTLAVCFGAMFLVQAFTELWLREFVVTDRRLLIVDWRARDSARNNPGGGDRSDGSTSVWLDSIVEVTMEQDLPGIWLGYGTLRVSSADGEGLVLPRMRRPTELYLVIQEQRQHQA